MTDHEIQLLKASVGKVIELETTFGERLVVKVQIVTDDYENNVHDVMHTVVSSNMMDSYPDEDRSGYLLDFIEIASVKAADDRQA